MKPKPHHWAVLAFPVTRSQAEPSQTEDRENGDRDLEEEEQEEAGEKQKQTENELDSEDEEPTSRQEETQGAYKKLSLRFLEKLKKACAQYGPTAPYTLALLENQSAQWLTPNDWKFLA
jgi:hypothetical protein